MRTRILVQYGIMKNGLRRKYVTHRESFSSERSSNGCGEIVSIFIWIMIDKWLLKRKTKQNSFSMKHITSEIVRQDFTVYLSKNVSPVLEYRSISDTFMR